MSTIFLDPSAVADSDAPARLAHLVEAGHRLVLVGAPGPSSGEGLTGGELTGDTAAGRIRWAGRAPTLPDAAPRGSWFVTADPATCGGRRPGLRTILIGPREDHRRPTRCDASARDLRDAVLEILGKDAMG